ncbi:MAG: prepilin-type N-terminal cleavage/methylation domain-containing protein [Patescibacteria group bacterium]
MKAINRRGISLIETMVAVALTAVFVVGIASLFTTSIQSRKIIWEQLSTQEEGRKIVQDFATEVRGACYSGTGAYPLEIATSTEVAFFSNIDTDNAIERIHYKLVGTFLNKSIIKPAGDPPSYVTTTETFITMVHDVVYETSTPIFTYYPATYDGTGSAMTSTIFKPYVRMIGIKLQLEERPNFSPTPFNIESKVLMRNLKDN